MKKSTLRSTTKVIGFSVFLILRRFFVEIFGIYNVCFQCHEVPSLMISFIKYFSLGLREFSQLSDYHRRHPTLEHCFTGDCKCKWVIGIVKFSSESNFFLSNVSSSRFLENFALILSDRHASNLPIRVN